MSAGTIELTGTITVPEDRLELFRSALVVHEHLSLRDPGCLVFDVRPSAEDPCRYVVFERFEDRETFEAHKARAQASDWWRITGGFRRDYHERLVPGDAAHEAGSDPEPGSKTAS